MRMPQFVGLIGGKPGFAYYFCGLTEENDDQNQLVFLDPHLVRSSHATNSCDEPRTLDMAQLDPCFSFGFLIKSEADFYDFYWRLDQGSVLFAPN